MGVGEWVGAEAYCNFCFGYVAKLRLELGCQSGAFTIELCDQVTGAELKRDCFGRELGPVDDFGWCRWGTASVDGVVHYVNGSLVKVWCVYEW